jgi:VanZ family protein
MVGIVLIANSGHGPRVFAFVAWIPHYDKVGHFLLMGILSLLAVAAVAPRLRWRPLVSSSVVVSVVAAIVTLEELSQSKFASRTYSGIDLLFSLAGIVSLGLLGHYIAFQAKRQRNH